MKPTERSRILQILNHHQPHAAGNAYNLWHDLREDLIKMTHDLQNETILATFRPSEYRLARTENDELILQGLIAWRSETSGGEDWVNIPTFDIGLGTTI